MAKHSLTVDSPSKLNIDLRILGRRADGLHEINSLMTLIDFSDTITVHTHDDDLGIYRLWKHPRVDDDLCIRAAAAFRHATNTRAGVSIHVDKKIPIGGGLGGGSSNAASVLLALNHLWNVRWSTQRLMALASSLGADIPFFIFGKTARATGAGEILNAAHDRFLDQHKYFLLAMPDIQSVTAEVYAEYKKNQATKCKIDGVLDDNKNDLVNAVFNLYPAIIETANQLRHATGQAHLSGSGSSLFAAFTTRTAAQVAQATMSPSIKTAIATALPKRIPIHHGE